MRHTETPLTGWLNAEGWFRRRSLRSQHIRQVDRQDRPDRQVRPEWQGTIGIITGRTSRTRLVQRRGTLSARRWTIVGRLGSSTRSSIRRPASQFNLQGITALAALQTPPA